MKHRYTTTEVSEILECSLVWVWKLSLRIGVQRKKGKGKKSRNARYTVSEIIEMANLMRNPLKIRDKISRVLIESD